LMRRVMERPLQSGVTHSSALIRTHPHSRRKSSSRPLPSRHLTSWRAWPTPGVASQPTSGHGHADAAGALRHLAPVALEHVGQLGRDRAHAQPAAADVGARRVLRAVGRAGGGAGRMAGWRGRVGQAGGGAGRKAGRRGRVGQAVVEQDGRLDGGGGLTDSMVVVSKRTRGRQRLKLHPQGVWVQTCGASGRRLC